MKKLLTILLLIFFISISTIAYSQNEKSIYFAPKVSFGLSNYTRTLNSIFKGTISGGVALGVKIPILGTIEASAIYSSAGAEFIYDDLDYPMLSSYSSDEITLRSQYLYVPVVLKMYLIGGLNLYLGPQFDFLVGEKLKYGKFTEKTSLLREKSVSGVIGAGYDFKRGLGIAFNYNMGFSDASIGTITDTVFENIKNPKNKNMSIVLSYRF
ncbi:MAG: outer membrane beta-barrel protein [Rikenellaceae bacterium]